jgi:hypothetical protein
MEQAIVDECHDRFHRLRWSVVESYFLTDIGLVWQVDGTDGEQTLLGGSDPGRGVAVGR